MRQIWLLTVVLSICSCILAQQGGYNYPQPQTPFDTSQSNGISSGAQQTAPGSDIPTKAPSKPTSGSSFNGYPSGRPTAPGASGGFPSGPSASNGPSGIPSSGYGSSKPVNNGGYQSPSVSSGYPTPNQIGQGQQSGNTPGFSNGGQTRPTGEEQSQSPHFGGGNQNNGPSDGSGGSPPEENEGDLSAIPGQPDVDYPILASIPETSFSCDQQQYPGYYADVEARCQVFHVCANNKTYDFLCPNGTIFHQEYLVCVWWNQFDCNSATSLYSVNANLNDQSIGGAGSNPNDGGNAAGGNYGSQNSGYPTPGAPQGGHPSNEQNGSGIRQSTDSASYPSGPSSGGSQRPYPENASHQSPNAGQGGDGSKYLPPQQNSNNNRFSPQGPSGSGSPSREYLPPHGGNGRK